MAKARTNIYITQRQRQQLEKRSREEDLPMAEIIRRALDAYLEQVLGKPESPPAIGAAEEDGRALFAAYSGTLSEKLRRIAHSGTMPDDRGRVD